MDGKCFPTRDRNRKKETNNLINSISSIETVLQQVFDRVAPLLIQEPNRTICPSSIVKKAKKGSPGHLSRHHKTSNQIEGKLNEVTPCAVSVLFPPLQTNVCSLISPNYRPQVTPQGSQPPA
jgi:hypothetical protein